MLGVKTLLARHSKQRAHRESHARRLSFEPLEDRHMLATFMVNSLSDAAAPPPGELTLRQAITAANVAADADEIHFAPGLSGTIELSIVADTSIGASALVVSSPITIRGNTNGITIARAAEAPEMRLFRVTANGNLTVESVNLTGGVARGAAGEPGGNGSDGRGGALFNEGTLHVVASTLYNHVAIGGTAGEGGIGGQGLGGAIFNAAGTLSVRNATLSGNQALNSSESPANAAFGGGIYAINGNLTVYNSTITESTAATGRGLYFLAIAVAANPIIHSSIIAQGDDSQFDLFASYDAGGTVDVNGANNLIRRLNDFQDIAIPEFVFPAPGDPLLGPLTDNGGPTLTHALLTQSPAIDRGTNLLNLTTDQRGSPFARAVGDGVDVGAFESSVVAPILRGDYNRDDSVNAADYVLWRKFLESDVEAFAWADGDGSGHIDSEDYGVWMQDFSETPSPGFTTPNSNSNASTSAYRKRHLERALEPPYAVALFELKDEEVARRKVLPLPLETRPADDESQDEALLKVLIGWDGATRAGRERFTFE
jgi:hypothetical protein